MSRKIGANDGLLAPTANKADACTQEHDKSSHHVVRIFYKRPVRTGNWGFRKGRVRSQRTTRNAPDVLTRLHDNAVHRARTPIERQTLPSLVQTTPRSYSNVQHTIYSMVKRPKYEDAVEDEQTAR